MMPEQPEQPEQSYYHSFPESKFELVSHFGTMELAVVGIVVCGLLHFRSEPALQVRVRDKSLREWISVILFAYVLPSVFLVRSLRSYGASDGNEGDDDHFLRATTAGAIMGIAAAIEGTLLAYFWANNHQHRVLPRLGRRVLFLAMSVVLSAVIFTNHYNRLDYYGPVRVTSVGTKWVRPQQKLESSHNMGPSYFYYYRLQQTIEWGDSWACPDSKHWCSVSDDLYWNECQKEIYCQGRPEDYKNGECATKEQQDEALSYLVQCFRQQVEKEGLWSGDIAAYTAFNHSVAPWDDPPPKLHTVTRAVTCRPQACSAKVTAPPEILAQQATVEWMVAIVLLLLGTVLLALGIWTGQEQEPRVAPRASAVPAHQFQQLSTKDEGPQDLELSPELSTKQKALAAEPLV